MPVSRVTFTAGLTATPYTAGDVVGGLLRFAGLPANQDVLLTTLDLRVNIAANPSSAMTSFRLHCYNDCPGSALADNTAWDLPAGDRVNYLGYVDLGTIADVGASLYVQVDGVNKQVQTGPVGLCCYLVTNAAYTPAGNAETYAASIAAALL